MLVQKPYLLYKKRFPRPPHPLSNESQTQKEGFASAPRAAPDPRAAAFPGHAARDATRDSFLARACLAECAHAIACPALPAYLASALAQRAVHHHLLIASSQVSDRRRHAQQQAAPPVAFIGGDGSKVRF